MNDDRPPLAYLLTLRTYGTWLPGSSAGWKTRSAPGIQEPDPRIEAHSRNLMRWPPLLLDARQRDAIERSLRAMCAARGWRLHDMVVLDKHLHAVITADLAPLAFRAAVKARMTTDVKCADLLERERALWSDFGSVRPIVDEAGVVAACEYVDAHRPP